MWPLTNSTINCSTFRTHQCLCVCSDKWFMERFDEDVMRRYLNGGMIYYLAHTVLMSIVGTGWGFSTKFEALLMLFLSMLVAVDISETPNPHMKNNTLILTCLSNRIHAIAIVSIWCDGYVKFSILDLQEAIKCGMQ